MNYKKNFIGKGRKVNGMDIVKVTLRIAELMKFAHEYKGEKYISMEIRPLKEPDQFGHDYTVYVNTREEEKTGSTGKKRSSARKQKEEEPAF